MSIASRRSLRIFSANRVLCLRSLSSTTNTRTTSDAPSTSFGYYLSSFAEECPCSYHAALSDCERTDQLKSQKARSTRQQGSTLVLNDDQQFLLACESPVHASSHGSKSSTHQQGSTLVLNDDQQFLLACESPVHASSHGSKTSSAANSPAASSVDVYKYLANEAPSELYPSRHQQHQFVKKMQKIQPISGQDIDTQPLPRSLLTATFDARAVVITEPDHPFKIVAVNDAWTGLCGFTQKEAEGKSLKDLIQGPDTDTSALGAMVEELMTGYEARAITTNYTKAGRPFQNMLRVGHTNDKYLVGVLREMAPAETTSVDLTTAGTDVVQDRAFA